jgi:hypothetical protein
LRSLPIQMLKTISILTLLDIILFERSTLTICAVLSWDTTQQPYVKKPSYGSFDTLRGRAED